MKFAIQHYAAHIVGKTITQWDDLSNATRSFTAKRVALDITGMVNVYGDKDSDVIRVIPERIDQLIDTGQAMFRGQIEGQIFIMRWWIK